MSRATCNVEGCDAPVRCKGLCSRHYHQQRHGGELTLGPRKTGPPKRPEGFGPDARQRNCLKCGRRFWSRHRFNKLCTRCNLENERVRGRSAYAGRELLRAL